MNQNISILGQNFLMHPSGALFWEEKATLFISDVHLGKVSHFRKFGAAIPRKAIQKNFDLLNEVITFFDPKIICFLGDLFHSSLNNEWNLFKKWVPTRKSQIILVSGNHDIISPLKYEELGIQVVSEIQTEGFLFTHHPEQRDGFFNIAGHIHPAIRLKGEGRQTLRLPCFFKKPWQLILPAFGEFTGTHVLEKNEDDEVFAIADNSVLKI